MAGPLNAVVQQRTAFYKDTHNALSLPSDALTHHGQETWNLRAARGIENVNLCSVHLNMCLLGRRFVMCQQVYLGKNVAIIRNFTDIMHNPPTRRPFHFREVCH